MIDDDDLKIRRNLVIFSALVILAEWFDLRLGQLAANVLRLEADLDPLKLCIAALATLAYLALRYKDAALFGEKKYSDVVDEDLARITPTVITHYAQFMANLYFWTGYEASIFVGGIGKHATDKAEGMGEVVAAGGPSTHSPFIVRRTHYREVSNFDSEFKVQCVPDYVHDCQMDCR